VTNVALASLALVILIASTSHPARAAAEDEDPMPNARDILPLLWGPTAATVSGHSIVAPAGGYGSGGLAFTSMPVDELHEHFAAALSASGWIQTQGEVDGIAPRDLTHA